MQEWTEMERFMVAEAERDLLRGEDPRPCLTAFAGGTPLVLAFLRSFSKGGYHDPIIELVSLAAPLGADRLKLSVSGRAWSFDDPIPPVDDDLGDPRQRVLHIETADGSRGRARSSSAMFPYDVVDGAVRWGEPSRMTESTGWIPYALHKAVRLRHGFRGTPIEELCRQAERCVRLGHLLAFGPDVADRLGIASPHR